MTDIPWWVDESEETFLNPTDADVPHGWWKVDDSIELYTHAVTIHYPPRVHVFYVLDKLDTDSGEWKEINGFHHSKELADNSARKRAYDDKTPYRVRIVVSHE